MTTRVLLETLARRWYVVIVGLALTVAMMWHVDQHPGVYWTQVDVTFLTPKSEAFPNSIEQTTSGVIATAGLVAYELNDGATDPAASSSTSTLADEGVRDGSRITLPNSGGQWAYNFERPVLDVQVVAADPATVRQRLVHEVRRINQKLAQLQRQRDVRPQDYITTLSAPTRAQIFYLDGYPARALIVVLLLGVTGTAVLVVGVDRLMARRQRSRVTVKRTRLLAH